MIKGVLEFREVYAMPAYYQVAYDRIAQLLHHLLALGQEELVKKYAEIQTIDTPQFDPETQNCRTAPESHISLFTFVPALKKLRDLQQVFSWDNYSTPWSVWEHLDLAYWCWHTPFSYFKDKKLEYNDGKECTNSGFLLNLHAHWLEMNDIKESTRSLDKVLFFTRERFSDYLKVIIHQVISHQEIYGVADTSQETKSPHALELKLDDFGKLILQVEWSEGITAEEYLIHTFNDESTYEAFTQELLDAKPNTPVDIGERASGATIAKYLSRIKLQNTLLTEIFFVRRKTHEMALRSIRVELSEFPDINLAKLREQIRQFAPTDKRWSGIK